VSRQLALKIGLPDFASFDNFYPGSNAEIVNAVRELATGRPGVLFVQGVAGSGKSHLMYAAVKEAVSRSRTAVYLSRKVGSEDGEWLELSGEGLVCIDDINDGLTRPEADALFSLYERSRSGSGSLLLGSRRPPSGVDWRLPDLSSRVQSDLVYRLAALSEEELEAALHLRAEHRGLRLTDDVVRFVLRRYERSPVALFRLLDRIDVESLARQRRITIPFLRALEVDTGDR